MDYLRKYHDTLQDKEREENVKAFTEEHPVLSNIASPFVNLAGGFGYGGATLSNYLSGKPLTHDGPEADILELGRDIKSTSKGLIDENVSDELKGVANLAYDTGGGVGEFVVAKSVPLLGPLLMAASAFGNAAYDAVEKDVNPSQAIGTALISGGSEYLLNKLPFGTFDDALKSGNKSVVKNIARQGAAEAIEEGTTEGINTIADALINKEKSDFALAKQQYMRSGMSEEEATKQALVDSAKNVGYSALVGGLSGSTIGGGTTLYNGLVNRNVVDNSSELDPLGALNATVEGEQQTIGNQPAQTEPLNVAQPTPQDSTSLIQPLETDNPINVAPMQENVSNQPLSDGGKSVIDNAKSKADSTTHTPEQLKVMEEYKGSSNSQIGTWVQRQRKGERAYKYLPVATVNDAVADYVQEQYGLDIHGNSIGLNKSSLNHIDNEHINNNSKSIMTDEDLERIGYVLEHPDDVVATDETTPATRTKSNEAAPKIVLRKRIDGHYYIVEAVTDAKTQQDVVITAFIEEVGKESPEYAELFKGAYHVPSALEKSSPLANAQDVHENSSFDNNIPNSAENVNNAPKKMKVSQTATNSFRNSNMFKKSQLSTDTLNNMILDGGFDVDVVSENESLERASAMLDNDYNGTISRLQSNEQYSGVDTDAAMMVLEDKLNTSMQSGDYTDAMKWARMIVDKSHKLGQGLQALAKYSRTATGTVVKAQKMADTSVNNYFGKNKNLEKSVGKFGAALKRIGDTSPKQEVAPKTREQVVAEIRNALNKEASSIADLFSEENINEFADMIMAGRSVDEIQSQIEHFLMHGTTYAFTVDENARRETSQKLRNALDAVVHTKDTTKTPKSIEQIRKEVANTIAEENTSIYKNFTDDDIEYLARAIQNGMPTKDLTAMLKQKLVTGSFGISDADLKEITNLFNEADKYGEFSKEAYDLHQKAYAIAAKYVGNSSFMDKWNAWRYLAMLGNARTHIKNMGGNTVMNLVSGVKNNIAATIESGINTATGGKVGRTKSVLNPTNSKDRNLISASKKDANNIYSLLNKGGSKYDMKKEIEGNRSVFKSRLLNSLSNLNTMALEAEDFFFLQAKYSTSLAGYLKANGKDTSIFESTNEADVEMLNKAREYAIKEAQQAAFHEASKAAEALNNLSKTLRQGGIGSNLADVLLEGTLPFKKTPINILKQGLRYSPAGLVKGLTYDLQQLKKGNKTATDVINDISTGLTGSSIVMLGAFLFANGLISSSGSADDEEATEEALIGKQNYAIQFPDGSSYTIDWMAPSSLPLFVGVELGKMWQGEDIDFADAMISIANPIVEMSMLQGISNTLESIRYGESSLGDLFVNTATSYGTQAVPTALGQVARAVDDTRRATYTGDSGVANSFKKAIKKSINKVPMLSETQEPYIDEWGRTQENEGGSFLGRLAYNMLSPGYYSKENVTSVDAELMNLANLTGDTSIYPNYTDSNPMEEGKLSPEKYTEYATAKGKAQFEALDTLFSTDAYKGLSESAKVNVIGDIYNFTNALAKAEVLGYDIEGNDAYKKTYSVYKDKGYEGVALYISIKDAQDGSTNADRVNAVNQFDISSEDKGYYLTKMINLSNEANAILEAEGYAGVYNHYFEKTTDDRADIEYQKWVEGMIGTEKSDSKNQGNEYSKWVESLLTQ